RLSVLRPRWQRSPGTGPLRHAQPTSRADAQRLPRRGVMLRPPIAALSLRYSPRELHMTPNIATDTFTGLAFSANNEMWIIPAGVVVFSQFTAIADAVGGLTNNTLINQGLIHGGSGWSAIRLN